MTSLKSKREPVRVDVDSIGGIDETTVSFSPGVTILADRNATNKTSFLQAIMAAMGSDQVSLKGDADEGSVELALGDETYTRTFTRENGHVVSGGDPYLDDPAIADLFAFLLESNEARRSVARGEDLRELILRPVDTEQLQAEITRLESQKQQLDEDLDELSTLERNLPDLESERADLEAQIEQKREELEQKKEEIKQADTSVSESREEKEEFEQTLDELKATRSELDDVRFQLETERESLEALTEEREELETKREELPDSVDDAIREVRAEIETLREQRRNLDNTLNELQTILEFNEEMLEGTGPNHLEAVRDEGDGNPADELLESETTVTCWTCGSNVAHGEIEGTLETLRDLRKEKASERKEVSQRLDELAEEQSNLETRKNEREQVERRLDQIDQEIDRREQSVTDLNDRREQLLDKIDALEDAVDEREADIRSDILDQHREANQLEFELDRLETELDDVETEIASIESRLEERDELETRRVEVQEELRDLRTRIDQIEQEAVEQFNTHMGEVLDLLDYANLERIWIEQAEREVRDGRRKTTKSTFDLHVVRSTDAGATYEDTIDHLSESEREVTGLIFALAGYLVHDVHEIVPFMLLDSLEGLDSDRIDDLIDYLQQYTEYLVVALLSDDAAALDEEYERVTGI